MRKIIFLIFLPISLNVFAISETWEAEIKPPYISQTAGSEFTMGTGCILWFTLEIQRKPDGSLSGDVNIRSPKARCAAYAELEYVSIIEDAIRIKSKPIPRPQCGYFYFEGKIDGDKWIGMF